MDIELKTCIISNKNNDRSNTPIKVSLTSLTTEKVKTPNNDNIIIKGKTNAKQITNKRKFNTVKNSYSKIAMDISSIQSPELKATYCVNNVKMTRKKPHTSTNQEQSKYIIERNMECIDIMKTNDLDRPERPERQERQEIQESQEERDHAENKTEQISENFIDNNESSSKNNHQ